MKTNLLRALAVIMLALALLLTLASCRQTEGDEQIPENMQYATLEGSLYRLFVPADWNLMTGTGVSGAYASLQTSTVIYLRDYESLDGDALGYARQTHTAALLATFLEDDNAFVSEPQLTTLGGQAAYSLDYTGTRGNVTYRGCDVVCLQSERIYVLTFCAQKDVYDAYLTDYDAVLATFSWSDTPFVPSKNVNTVDEQATAPAGMKLASNDDVAYRFYVPTDWVLDRALPTSSAYVSESDRSNVNVTVYMPANGYPTVSDYWQEVEPTLRQAMPDMTVLSTTERTLDAQNAVTYVYRATVDGTLFRFAQTITSYRGMIYTVTYTALEDSFDAHWQQYEQMLAAFDFRGNN